MDRFLLTGLAPRLRPRSNLAGMTCLSLLVLSTLSPVTPCKGDSAGFEATGNLSAARYDHTATLLLGGKVLVAGGFNYSGGGPPTMAEVYDPCDRDLGLHR